MPENRLINEKSPYLLQHAHNPVDWYPWGEEAFESAKNQEKPIFLSIGYATCHWCHVMARESFDSPVIAQRLNDVFICIKVDREELPEIDSLYMEFAQALMASGTGWPLNVILTPDLKPFYAVTYLPPEPRQGMMGLNELINHIQQLWESEEKELLFDQANKLVDLFEKSVTTRGDEIPTNGLIDEALDFLFETADPVYGGMKGAPKFPLGYQTQFFLNYSKTHEDSRPLFFVEKTLERMYLGGIYDHVGGGFSRYSVDEKWLVPHFEKMLYDNAILAGAYLNAWKFTKKEGLKTICQEVLEYVLRDMKHPEGGFYSAEDAEIDGVEGAFYLWTKDEIREILPPDQFDLFCNYFDVTDIGNFQGKNILHRTVPIEEFCEYRNLNSIETEGMLKNALTRLFEERQKRKRPFKDDKVLVSWNALMIETFVQAGMAFDNATYVEAGENAAKFIRANLWKKGKLLRRYREGAADYEGSLDDYASLIRALITLYEAGRGEDYLNWALEMTSHLESEYKADEGAFYLTGPNHSILMRRCELYDSAQPSGNALHAENLLRLYQITHNRDYWIQAEDILKVAKSFIEAYPQGASYHLIAIQRYLDKGATTLMIVLNENNDLEEGIKKLIFSNFHPHLSIAWKKNSEDYPSVEGKTTVYPCKQGKCQLPITDWDQIESLIHSL
ncbi:MAG: thioredoxin domain-containing protein [Chlamydiales bacterium]|nr:thioredoxin domain-containing protein [Chlamydiales bacterium]